jgi:hypothetical protein
MAKFHGLSSRCREKAAEMTSWEERRATTWFYKSILAVAIALPGALSGMGSASAVPFTWDPSQANPPLSAAGSAFTADTVNVTTYLHAIHPPDGSFVLDQLLNVVGFQLNGQPVTSPGFGSTYGLYFRINSTGQTIGGITTYNTIDISLMADPGNNDGSISASATGISFSNIGPTGAADDLILGTGTLLSGSLAFNPATMVINAHYVESLAPAPGETAFFGTHVLTGLDISLTTPLGALQTLPPGPDGTFIQLVNGATGQVTAVPEPSSMILLTSGLFALALVRRRRSGSRPTGNCWAGWPAGRDDASEQASFAIQRWIDFLPFPEFLSRRADITVARVIVGKP